VSNVLYTSVFEPVNLAGSTLFCAYVNRSSAAVTVSTEIVALNGTIIGTENSTINPNNGTAVGNEIALAAYCRFTVQNGGTKAGIVASGELKTAAGERTSLPAQ